MSPSQAGGSLEKRIKHILAYTVLRLTLQKFSD